MEIDADCSSHPDDLSPNERDPLSGRLLSEEHLELGRRPRNAPRYSKWWHAIIPARVNQWRRGRLNSAFEKWKTKNRKPPSRAALLFSAVSIIMVTSMALLIAYTIRLRNLIPHHDIQRLIASWGKPDTPTESQAQYPTSFSRDIIPIPCHSHNDYWRRVPLYEALAAGCVGVEADVWYGPNDLLVGHTPSSLTESRTLRSLYLDPLLSILQHQSPPSGPLGAKPTSRNGVFDTSPETPLILLIDIKNDAEKVFAAVHDELEPLRAGGWLTHFNGSDVVQGQITVVGTGDTPFDLLVANGTYRDIFFDAPIERLWGGDAPASASRYTAENSYYASVDFEAAIGKPWHGVLTPRQVELLRGQIGEANRRGLKARYWNTPSWPVGTMEHVWDVLMKEGAGMLNVDDLEGARRREWGGKR